MNSRQRVWRPNVQWFDVAMRNRPKLAVIGSTCQLSAQCPTVARRSGATTMIDVDTTKPTQARTHELPSTPISSTGALDCLTMVMSVPQPRLCAIGRINAYGRAGFQPRFRDDPRGLRSRLQWEQEQPRRRVTVSGLEPWAMVMSLCSAVLGLNVTLTTEVLEPAMRVNKSRSRSPLS